MPVEGAEDARQARLLGGRALFRIERDPSNPFEVTTQNAEVMVLGTTFTVETNDVETEVVLVSGVVTLAPRATPDAAVTLAPGQRSTVLALDAPSAARARRPRHAGLVGDRLPRATSPSANWRSG